MQVNPRHKLENPNRPVPSIVPSYKGEHGVKIGLRLISALFLDAV